MAGLRIRKLADRSDGERIHRFHPLTGERMLVKPSSLEAEDFDYEAMTPDPWPLAGVVVERPPKRCLVPTSFVAQGRAEGWIEVTGEKIVHRPAGPVANPWALSHTFVQLRTVTLRTADGDLRYKVVHNPDKYVDSDDDADEVTDEHYAEGHTRVDWFYTLERAG